MSQKIEQWMRNAADEIAMHWRTIGWTSRFAEIIAYHAPSDHLSLELADRDRIIKGLVADNERLVAESYVAGMGDGAKLARRANQACPSCGSPDKDFRRCSNPQHSSLGNVHPLVRFECERCIDSWHEPLLLFKSLSDKVEDGEVSTDSLCVGANTEEAAAQPKLGDIGLETLPVSRTHDDGVAVRYGESPQESKRRQGHKALRWVNGKLETFDPHPEIEHNDH